MLEIEHLVRYKLFFLLIGVNIILGQKHPNDKIDSLLKSGIDNIILQDYSAASKCFIDLNNSFPNHPLGNIYLAATEIARSVDYAEILNERLIDSLLSIAQLKTDELLENDSDNLWYNYYSALIYGYKAYFFSISGNIISAFADGILSLRSFQKCLSINDRFYEAYIAMGSYNYWKSAQTKSLLWIPFVSDNRDEGIKHLEQAIDSSSYNKYLAAYSLIWIYIDYGESEKAVELSLKMLSNYSGSRYFKWGLARAYQDVDKNKSIETYTEILLSIESNNKRNQFNDIVLRHKLAMLNYDIRKYNVAFDLCNEILDFKFKSVQIKERLKDRIERTQILREKILDELESNR